MITNGFTYIAVLVFLAAILVLLEKKTKWKLFKFLPAVVLIYLLAMILCTMKVWDLEATSPAYDAMKNNLLFAMIMLMLLRCDIRQIIKLGPKMLGSFFAASISIGIGFIITYAVLHSQLGAQAWKALGALCGSWMGGSGNMIAIQGALNISSEAMSYALVIDSIYYSVWVMLLLWAISYAPKFNKWTKSSSKVLDEVCTCLEHEQAQKDHCITFPNILFLLGAALLTSAVAQKVGMLLNQVTPWLDKTTCTVLVVTLVGLVCAVTPMGKIAGATELSNVMLYVIIALLASRASLLEMNDAPVWILSGFMIMTIHATILIIIAKIFKLDMVTCGIASLANIGGTASASVLAASYSPALVPVGVLMAMLGTIIGTGGGLLVAKIMSLFA